MPNKNVGTKFSQLSTPLALVGIGSAAGGLDALKHLLASVPADLGVAIVVAHHLATDGSIQLHKIVGTFSSLPVQEIPSAPIPLKANQVYIAPEQCQVELIEEGLRATRIEERRGALVDSMFQSLASSAKMPVVGIVLSGDGCDGTLGLKAISDAGGMTVAQDPATATHDEMPRSAASEGHADHVLEPDKIPALLQDYVSHLKRLRNAANDQTRREEIETELPSICDALLEATEHDFRHYKTNTLTRRVGRRMQVLRLTRARDYLERLREDREEARALFHDLLISVTAFFRDPDTFAAVVNLVIPNLLANVKEDQPLRIWVPGCATGEEAYTLAILIREALDSHKTHVEVQLFATDIDQRALNVARTGSYPVSIADQLTKNRLNRFFKKSGNHYTVVKEIRDMCVFSIHNLISDPPFSQMDLISCRNLLIYLGQPLQLKLIPLFHFALRSGGYLLLGSSESLAAHAEIFRPVDQKHRISQRKPGPAKPGAVFSAPASSRNLTSTVPNSTPNEHEIYQISQRIILDEFAPRHAVVNEEGQLISSSPGLEKYFEFPDGPFQNNVIRLAKPGLRSGLRAALREAQGSLRTVKRKNLTMKTGDHVQRIELVVQPMPEIGEMTGLFMLVFRDLTTSGPASFETGSMSDSENTIVQLERELDQTRLDLENTVRDLVSSNEELKSSNEELISFNEELHSANEELKTSKEEVQAGMEALAHSRRDLQNLLDGTKIATIFLDETDHIKSFTPSVSEIYNLKEGDIGRPLSDITHKALEMPPLSAIGELDAESKTALDEIRTSEDRWFARRILPYKEEDRPTGRILTFVDITEQKRAEIRLAVAHSVTQLLAVAESFDEVMPEILDAIRDNLDVDVCALWLIDSDSGSLFCAELAVRGNTPCLEPFLESTRDLRLPHGKGLAGRVWETKEPLWIDNLRDDQQFYRSAQAWESGLISGLGIPILSGKHFHGSFEIFANRVLRHEQSKLDMLLKVGHEIGQFILRKRIDSKFRNEESRKAAILDASLDSIITMDIHGKIMDFNVAAESTFDIAREAVVGRLLAEVIIPPEFREAHAQGLERYLRSGQAEVLGKRLELTAQRSDGSQFPIELSINVAYAPDGVPFFTGYLRDIRQRRQAEDALRDSEGRASALVTASSQMVWTTDGEGKVVEDSPTWRVFTGQTFEEFRGDGWTNVLHPEEREQAFAAWKAANETLEPWIYEYRVRHASGEWRWTAVRGVPQLRPDGSVLRWVGMNTDITEQKQLQLSLIESEQRLLENQDKLIRALSLAENKGAQLRVLFDQSFYFAAMLDLEGFVTDANETSLVLCGYEREQVVGVKFWECPWWRGSQQIQDTVRRAVDRSTKGVFYRAELPYWLSDGTQRLVDFVLTPALNESGEVIFIVPTGCDVTEKKQTEQRLTMALKAGGMAAWEWTPRKSFWPDALYELLGISSDTPSTSEAFFELVHPDDLPRVKQAWDRATSGYEPYDEQFRIIRPTGEVRWIAGVGEIERNDEGDVIRIVGLNWDVTEEHAAADALRESERQAQEANRAKSDFLANMSHEIRTPMTAILGYADLLAKEEFNPEKAKYLQVIKRNGLFLLDIINDILDLSKIEAGKMDVSRERFNVQKVIADVRSTMDVRAREKQLEFAVEYEGRIPATIESDPKRVKQILVNLVGNAIKFTESGSVRLVVSYQSDLPQPLLRFEVIDTGIGILPEKLSLLFQPFSQADSSVSRKFGGTGLGLTISERLARVLGGQITVESVPGEGSTFACTILVGNMQEVELVEPQLNQSDLLRETNVTNRQLQCRVLVVDDRRDVRFLTQRILKDAGAEVSLAEDGLDAIRQLKQSLREEDTWDLILLDMQMPRLDGYQAATKMREMGFKGAIIALTADAMQGDMSLCLQSGCDNYLSKPIDTHQLLTMVAEYTNPTSRTKVGDLRVLVVDDSEDACTATQKLLEMRGFEVQTAFDGATALQVAESFVPHSIVLDISLPDMSGFEVLNRLKQMPQLGMTRFYALTGDGRTDDPKHWQQAGFHHLMIKPTDLDQLEALLRNNAENSTNAVP